MIKQPRSAIKPVFAVLVWLISVQLSAQDAIRDHLRQVITANSLTELGKTPFHLQMVFQYYDLQGKPTDAGLLEERWVSPDTYLVTVTLPSLNEGKPTPLDDVHDIDPREEYTLRFLLNAETRPVTSAFADSNKLIKESRKRLSKIELTCFSPGMGQAEICIDPQNDGVRVTTASKNFAAVVRNSLGIFENTNVPFDIALSYDDLPAISAHVKSIRVFDPSKSGTVIPNQPPSPARTLDMTGVKVGKVTHSVEAVLPDFIHGSRNKWVVLLGFHVMEDGTTSRIFAFRAEIQK